MTCDDAAGLLLPALTGRLAEPQALELGTHAASCPSCSKDFPEMQAIWQALDDWRDEEPPRPLVESVRRRLREEKE
jgi:hypothetical protein